MIRVVFSIDIGRFASNEAYVLNYMRSLGFTKTRMENSKELGNSVIVHSDEEMLLTQLKLSGGISTDQFVRYAYNNFGTNLILKDKNKKKNGIF